MPAARLAVAALLVCVAPCAAQPQGWTHRLVAPVPEGYSGLAFSPDGARLYASYPMPVIDVWSLAVSLWPELLGGVLALLTIVTLVLLLRRRSRRQSAGAPHCRRCNYDLSAHAAAERGLAFPPGTKCPECGSDLARRPPRRGRSFRRRAAIPLALWTGAAAAYAALFIAGVPRVNAASAWLDWSSAALARLAARWSSPWLSRRVTQGEQIAQYDTATGSFTRTLLTHRDRTFSDLAVSPDGAALLTWGAKGVKAFSTLTGRRISSAALPGYPGDVGYPFVLGFTPESAHAFVSWIDRDRGLCGVSRVNIRSGAAQTLVSTTHSPPGSTPRGSPWGRHFVMISSDPPVFVSYPHFMESYASKRFTLRVHDARVPDREIEVSVLPDLTSWVAIVRDAKLGPVARTIAEYGQSITGTVISTGDPAPTFRTTMGPSGRLDVSPDSATLAGGANNAVQLVSAADGKPARTLPLPPQLYAPSPKFSPDGKWLAANCQKNLGAPPNFTHEIVLWRLGE
jgi:hypothetical protein